jgi:hypothetical protein
MINGKDAGLSIALSSSIDIYNNKSSATIVDE